jgi:hypothetical protein
LPRPSTSTLPEPLEHRLFKQFFKYSVRMRTFSNLKSERRLQFPSVLERQDRLYPHGKAMDRQSLTSHCRTNFSFPADGARGSVLTNGTANGMIKMIQDKQVHVAVDAFGMSGIRATAVDFTVPLLSTRYTDH